MRDEERQSLYREIREGFPELFVNPDGAPIEILTDPADVAEAEKTAAAMLTDCGLSPEWSTTGVVYQDPYQILLRDPVRMPAGLGTYVRSISPGNAAGVVVLPRYRDEVVLLRHFRHATREWHLELPRGYGTAGAEVDDDARRELREEIGVPATRLEPLGIMYPDNGSAGTPVGLFYAEVSEEPRYPELGEGIDAIRRVSVGELAGLIADGTVNDGYTIAACTRAALRGLLPGFLPG